MTARSYIYPKGCGQPMELFPISINAAKTGQFEAHSDWQTMASYISYLEAALLRCDEFITAIVEMVELHTTEPEIKSQPYRTGYPGDKNGKGGIYNCVTKRLYKERRLKGVVDSGGDRLGHHLEISSCILKGGDNSVGEFYSVAVTNNYQQADTGTK